MALLGKAVMINWSDVLVEFRPAYFAWHNHEHIAGRLQVPGFQRGRRHMAIDADRDVFNLYEVDDLSILTGADYRQRTGNPSETTRAVSKGIVRSFRALANVKYSAGQGIGGVVRTIRFEAIPGSEAALEAYLVQAALPAVNACANIVSVHLCVADMDASTEVSTERKGRPTVVPGWSVIIEAANVEAARDAAQAHLPTSALQRHGAQGDVVAGVYGLQVCMSRHGG